eukprot:4172592-Ditylum_brightwellii.AAC.1
MSVVSLSCDPYDWAYICQNGICSEQTLDKADGKTAARHKKEIEDHPREEAKCIQKAVEMRKKTGCIAYNCSGINKVINDNLEQEHHPFMMEALPKDFLN